MTMPSIPKRSHRRRESREFLGLGCCPQRRRRLPARAVGEFALFALFPLPPSALVRGPSRVHRFGGSRGFRGFRYPLDLVECTPKVRQRKCRQFLGEERNCKRPVVHTRELKRAAVRSRRFASRRSQSCLPPV